MTQSCTSHHHNHRHPQGPHSHTKCDTWDAMIITSDFHMLHHGHTHHTHTHTRSLRLLPAKTNTSWDEDQTLSEALGSLTMGLGNKW